MKKTAIIGLFLFGGALFAAAQTLPSLYSRWTYYMNEPEGEILLSVPDTTFRFQALSLVSAGQVLSQSRVRLRPDLYSIRFPLKRLPQGTSEVLAMLTLPDHARMSLRTTVTILPRESNAVQTDRLTGGIQVDGLPFFPVGFYTYAPVQPNLLDEEVVRGFNVVSPYQKNLPETRAERKAYLDRAAALGMKVHFHLLSLTGGGGVLETTDVAQRQAIQAEIQAFRKHPALLGWYVSDEPTTRNISPDHLRSLYQFIKSIDPYHPVSIVFNETTHPIEFGDAMDVVMADPYPIPDQPITQVGIFTQKLKTDFETAKPVWMVPQAFGGNEWWKREPTRQEIRAMSYLAILRGATGLQYFIRHGLSAFPKSIEVWNEAGTVAKELTELAPFLLSDEVAMPVTSADDAVQVRAWRKKGSWLLMAVNTENTPKPIRLQIPELHWNGDAQVLFQNRAIKVVDHALEDWVDGYGTRVYRMDLGTPQTTVFPHPSNQIINPSFEDTPNVGTPDALYIRVGTERGATASTDNRVAIHGEKSLRLITPTTQQGLQLQFYPVQITSGQSYLVSVWARADAATSVRNGQFKLQFGEQNQTFTLTDSWQRYLMAIPAQALSGNAREMVQLSLLSAGTAWFDLLQFIPDPEIMPIFDADRHQIRLAMRSEDLTHPLTYTTDASDPHPDSLPYSDAIPATSTLTLRAATWNAGKKVGEAAFSTYHHLGFARPVRYEFPYNNAYPATREWALVDGQMASGSVQDPNWQGFLGDDLSVVVDLGAATDLSRIQINFLNDPEHWVFLPQDAEVSFSLDGIRFESAMPLRPMPLDEPLPMTPYLALVSAQARYIRLVARNVGTCPAGHVGLGEKAWLFADELVAE